MVLARAWQIFQQWRAVEKAGSATVQRALAQRDAAVKMGEEQAKRHAAMATNFADVAEKHVEATSNRDLTMLDSGSSTSSVKKKAQKTPCSPMLTSRLMPNVKTRTKKNMKKR